MLLLQGQDPVRSVDEDTKARFIRSILSEHPGDMTLEQVERFINNAPQKYLHSMPASKMAVHLMLLRQLGPDRMIAFEVSQPENFNYTEIAVVSRDVKGSLSATCAALSSKDINILSVQAFSTKDGYAIDVFQVTDLRGDKLPQGFRLDRLFNDLDDVIRNGKDPAEVFPQQRRRGAAAPNGERADLQTVKPAQVLINNEASPNYTVLEVKAYDRPGLLFDITSTCASQGYFIHLAMITTEAYRVVDVFYITDVEYNKLEAPQVRRLEAALKEIAGA
jgi:[protein-PII] uridylyltransferase